MKSKQTAGVFVVCLAAALAGCTVERTAGSPDGVMHQNTDSYTNYETPSRNYFGGGGDVHQPNINPNR